MELKVHFSNIEISVILNFRLCPGTWQSDLICFEMFSQGARGGDHRVGPGFGQGLRKEALAGRGPGDDHQHHRHHDCYPHLDHPHWHHDYHLHLDHPTRHHDRHINHQIISHQEKSQKFVSACFSGVSLWYTRASGTCYKGRVSGLFSSAMNTTLVNLWFLVKTFLILFSTVIYNNNFSGEIWEWNGSFCQVPWYFHIYWRPQLQLQPGVTSPRWRKWSLSTTRQRNTSRTRSWHEKGALSEIHQPLLQIWCIWLVGSTPTTIIQIQSKYKYTSPICPGGGLVQQCRD